MASYRSVPNPRDARRRAIAIALTVLAHLLIALLLLTLGTPLIERKDGQPGLSTFDVAREAGSAPKAAAAKKPVKIAAKSASAAAARAAPQPKVAAETPPPPVPVSPLWGDKSLLAGADIGRMSAAGDGAASSSGAGSGKGSGPVSGPGEGPGGSRLYNAEWYRRPSHAEIAGYMPPNGVPPGGWAEIACKTIPGNQVENCRSLGESPPGSGIARGLRQAAWQFRVLPPRIDGRPVIGAWVRIHFDFTAGGDGDAR